jgi:hypothetical protein
MCWMQCIDETKLSALFMLLSWLVKTRCMIDAGCIFRKRLVKDIPMSSYFRFIAFLAFKIFSIVG